VESSYSQEAETKADIIGVDIMQRSNINPQSLISFFEKIKKEQKSVESFQIFKYISSHPQTQSRIEAVNNYSASSNKKVDYKPVLSVSEWKNLKNICKATYK
jgi:predicted Zn-dependent protease